MAMAIRRQAAEWRNVVPQGDRKVRPTHPVLGRWTAADESAGRTYNETIETVGINPGDVVGVFTGGIGNNLVTSAHLKATEMIIIDSLSCWPPDASINVFVNSQYYFEAPDYSSVSGLSGYTVPFPEPNELNIFTFESFLEGIPTPIVIEPESTWGIYYTVEKATHDGSPTRDGQIGRVFVKYLLIDGSDLLLVNQMKELSIPITWSEIQRFRQDLIRHGLMADIGDEAFDQDLIDKTGVTTRRRSLP